MTHPHVQVLRNIDESMESGDLERFFSYYAEDVAVHIGGTSKLAGDYKGRDQLQEVFGRFMEAVGADYSYENHAYLADDEHGVSLQRSKVTRGDQVLELDEVFLVHFREGRVSEMWYLTQDQVAFDDWVG